ncbi:MAG: aminopeptidase [Bacteroidetes bacterium]|nr:aminopeptidase [Bacteroidota bacterium]
MKTIRSLIFILLFIPFLSVGQETKLLTFLKSIPGAEVKKVDSSVWAEFYVLMLPQPVDHSNPGGAWFKQRIYVGHRGYDRPTVMETEGYGAEWMNGYLVDEPAEILNANQLYVEHRYFGASIPSKLEWKYLTVEQDAADYHTIRKLFGEIYTGKWITTGVSKGGQTATEYKVFYPDDVDVTIPYVAPLNYSLIDKRIEKHFRKVGTAANRKQIRDIQFYLLKNKKTTLPLYKEICTYQGYTFTELDTETAFDYSVLELPFSFWQYTADCSKLPDLNNTSPEKMVAFLIKIVPPFWYTEAAHPFDAANYQFYTQLGYYEYDEWPFRKYLKMKDYPNSAFAPRGADVKWDGSYVHKLKRFMKNNPQHMIFVYGESDPWGATGAEIKPGMGSIKEVMAHGTHGATIRTLNPDQQAEVVKALNLWLGMDLHPNFKSN